MTRRNGQSFSRLDAKNAGCWESNLMIEGMHCAACALTIEDVLLRVPGVVTGECERGQPPGAGGLGGGCGVAVWLDAGD